MSIYFTWSNYLFDINANRASILIYYLLSDSSVIKLLSIIDGLKNWLIKSNFLLIKVHEFSFISTHIIFNVFTIFIFFQFYKFKNVLKYIVTINAFIITFLLVFLILYWMYFVDPEAANVASLARYIGIFYIPWTLGLIVFYYNFISKKTKNNIAI